MALSEPITRWPYKVPEVKDPQATLDYVIEWSDWLEPGEILVASEWEITEGDATLGTDTLTETAATAWVSGGTLGSSFSLTNTITTNSTPVARVDERTLIIKVKDK